MSHKSERILRDNQRCHGLLSSVGAPAVAQDGRPLELVERVEWACEMLRSFFVTDVNEIDPAVREELDRIQAESRDMPSMNYSTEFRKDFLRRLQQYKRGER